MRISEVRHAYELAAARGHIPQELVAKATVATILEAGAAAFHKAYFGNQAWNEAVEAARQSHGARAVSHAAQEEALGFVEHLVSDISPSYRALGAVHTTTDFPLALAQVRDRVRRDSYNPVESQVYGLARRRTANDFKALRGIRTDAFDRLKLRPEGTSVTYATFASTEDLYQIANYELAVGFTWEAWKNDDIGEFTIALANLGVAARRTRALITFEAIRAGTSRTTLSVANVEGTPAAGGPTPANVVGAYELLAGQTNADGKPMPRVLTTFAVPAKWTVTGRQTINGQHVVTGANATRVRDNAAFGLANMLVEPMMAEVMGVGGGGNNAADWIAFDGTQEWLEFAALAGYEAGPRTFTKMPDVLETLDEGSFDKHELAVKMSDNVGAKIVDSKSVLRIAGA
jgi:hypothetical protein